MRKFIVFLILCFSLPAFSQAVFNTMGTPYTQDFNTLPNTVDGASMTGGWTDNTTLLGWYSTITPTVESSLGSMNNNGSNYVIASGTDRSFGSRASGGTGTCYYGVRLVNSTGTIITSVYLQYYGEQWSIAENGSNVNTINVDYRTGTGLTSLTAGAWTNAPSLAFTQIYTSSQSSGMGGTACSGTSAQCLSLNGNASTNRTLIGGCVSVTLNPGDEIMFRWVDVNDAANDHHLQIDDVNIYPYDVSCAIVLPVHWISFTAERAGHTSLLQWETAAEENNDYFSIERLNENGYFVSIGTVDGHGTTPLANQYYFTDEYPAPGINYYRIRQIDFNGQSIFSVVRTVNFEEETSFDAFTSFDGSLHFQQNGNHGPTRITVFAEDGRAVSSAESEEVNGVLETPESSGVYFIRFENRTGTIVTRQLIIL